MDRARPKVLDQGDTRESNWVGRFAQWTERHYLLMDVIATIVLIALFDSRHVWRFANDRQCPVFAEPRADYNADDYYAFTLQPPPLPGGQRAGDGGAVCCATVVLTSILTINMYAMVSVYSAVLYGRESAWRWVSVALAANSWLAGIKVMAGWNGYSQLLHLFLPDGSSMPQNGGWFCPACCRAWESCWSVLPALRWLDGAVRVAQNSGAVATRGGAASRAGAAKVLAANQERNCISAAMQTEVLTTLNR